METIPECVKDEGNKFCMLLLSNQTYICLACTLAIDY